MWPQPGKEPLVDVDRDENSAVHHQAAVRTAIRPYPQRHVFLTLADMARPGGIAFIDEMQFFPKAQTLNRQASAQSRRAPNHYTPYDCESAACAALWGFHVPAFG
jgi:hypothetical protein